MDSREQFVPGKFRSELRMAIPKLRSDDIEWIVSAVISELQASRDAAIEECAALLQARAEWYGFNTQPRNTLLEYVDALRSLKGKG